MNLRSEKRAESTKLRVGYDPSAKSETGFSLNDCLEKGPPLQNKSWDVLVRSRFHQIILCADIEKAFLKIRIRESERDCLRFHWAEATNNDKIEIYCFAGLVKVTDDMYVDYLVTGRESINEVKKLKSDSITLFQQGGFKLHKWHFCETILETNDLCNTT